MSKRTADICERELGDLQSENQELRDKLMYFESILPNNQYRNNNRSDSPTTHGFNLAVFGQAAVQSEDEKDFNSTHISDFRTGSAAEGLDF